MKKMYARTITREIKQSFGRFVAIIAIVALGVGFLVGILSSTPDMKASVNQYYTETAMSDFDIKSTMGLTKKDVRALSGLTDVKQVMPAYAMDSLITTQDDELLTARIYGLDFSVARDSQINRLTLLEGRMPEGKHECVIENPNSYMDDLSIGEKVTLSPDNENLKDTYAQTTFTIVGIADSPYYFCNAKEPASAGNGRAGAILYTDSSAFCLDTYTDIFLTMKFTGDTFSSEYRDASDALAEKIEALSDVRVQARYDEIVKEANRELKKARTTLDREKKKAASKLKKAKSQLDQSASQLKKGRSGLAAAEKDLEEGSKELRTGTAEIRRGKQQLADGRRTLAEEKQKLDAAKDSVEQARQAMEAGVQLPAETVQQIKAYDKGLAAWQKGKARLDAQEQKLQSAEARIRMSRQQLADGRQQLQENRQKLKTAEKQLADGRRDYRTGKQAAISQIQSGEQKIKNAQKDIEEISMPEWYILDRSSNLSYARYKVDVEKVADIAAVFPIFFFLVAALVTLTTMTRMVEEERIQIGTLKALGYSHRTIMSKYLIYCGAAAFLGCLIGLAAGFHLLPTVIYQAYASQYDLPDLILQFNAKYAVLSCILEILCTVGAAWIACRQTLKEKPALLMIPRAPKAGKRILLERIGFIWNRLSFTHKATARNIFRYKKHLFMTIIGIAGCTALILTGFGLRDSMSTIVQTQYSQLFRYDMRIEMSDDREDSVLTEFLTGKACTKVYDSAGESSSSNREKVSASICVPSHNNALASFIQLRTMDDGTPIPFEEKSVIMTQKMADALELSIGDTFTLTNADDKKAEFTLTGITENYVGAYVYMANEVYQDAFGELEYNTYLLRSGLTDSKEQDKAAEKLLESDYVSSCEFTSQSKETYETILSSVTMIVYVLILCAGALAVVVLYNLTNINIKERTRELAALRVLGYHHNEVAGYIFREIGLLSILGTLTGLAVGWFFHKYVVVTAESVDYMMGRDISPVSFLLAAGITLLFSALVDFIMAFKLRKIQMAESMKAID